MTAVLELRNVSKTYDDGIGEVVRALREVDLTVAPGEMVAITGRSGSGKSTLINLAGGLETATSGDVVINERSLNGASRGELAEVRRRQVGYVFQNLNLIDDLTAGENVSLPAELDGVKPAVARRWAGHALRTVGVEELADRFPHEMSGGQRQRVAIARAVIAPAEGQRRLILADEPTAALDEMTARTVYDLLASLAADGATVIVATHDNQLAAYADRVVRLADGSVDQVTSRSVAPVNPAELLTGNTP